MSAFDTYESSLEASRPVEIYRVQVGTDDPYFWTSAATDITVLGDVYEATAINRSSVVLGSDARRRVLQLQVPGTNPFARLFIANPPGQLASVRISRVQLSDGTLTPQLMYRGSATSVQFQDNGKTATIAVQSVEAASSREIPRMVYMTPCNHVLYDDQCQVNPASFQLVSTVSAVSGNTITVTGAGSHPQSFVGGYVKPNAVSDFRLVLAQSGDVLTLLLPFFADPTGLTVTALPGCDHLLEGDCSQTFANEIEFGGYAFIPRRNPFEVGL